MKTNLRLAAAFLTLFFVQIISVPGQVSESKVKRTTYKTDSFDFGAGGTIAISGAPNGSIRVEGWNRNQVQIDAEIELTARNENELNELAKITGFVLEESMGRTGIISLGTHDKSYLKRVAKKFPKDLMGLPFKIDYVLKVPHYCDLQIDGGKGDLSVSGIDGTVKINFVDTNAKLVLLGGSVFATFGAGTVDVSVPTKSWRGRFADISLASGTMNVNLPPSINAEVDASILRSGRIENTFVDLRPKARKDTFTDKLIAAKSGNGGIPLKFTVGDGNMNISEYRKPE